MADDKSQNQNNNQAGQGGDGNGANNSNANANQNADNKGGNNNQNANNQNNGGDNKGDGGNNDHMIPKSRLDEETAKRKELEKWKADREKADQEAEAKRLEEQGKFKELAETEKKKREETEARYVKTTKVNALKFEALKNGTLDADAVVALANLDDIKLSEDGSIDTASVTALIEKMKTEKKYLFGEGNNNSSNTNIGANGGAPNNGGNTTPTFKRSQLSDPKFYKDNRDAILQAQREGKIVDDITPKS